MLLLNYDQKISIKLQNLFIRLITTTFSREWEIKRVEIVNSERIKALWDLGTKIGNSSNIATLIHFLTLYNDKIR